MKILFVSSEVAPFSKTGGLADVSGALPVALAKAGAEILVVTPKYKSITQPLEDSGKTVDVEMGDAKSTSRIFTARLGPKKKRAAIAFVDEPRYFDRDYLYSTPESDYHDNDERFAFLARAALETARALAFKPDALHLHDWQAALAGVYAKTVLASDPFFAGCKVVLTIHNLGYQGLFGRQTLARAGLPDSLFTPDALEFWGRANFLKGGIVFADAITTVSEAYAREITSPEHGMGLDGLLLSRKSSLRGILNGVDYSEWNPATDKRIAANYSPADMSGKSACKRDLLAEFDLEANPSVPVIGMVSRFAEQKGFDLVEKFLPDLMARPVKLVILGAGELRFEEPLRKLRSIHPPGFGLRIGYDNELAHKIEAGADMFLMPSRYEPCGLNQMYSLKYGTVPIVRATGGLDDTVEELPDGGTGFKFRSYEPGDLLACIDRALHAFGNRKLWEKIVANGMAMDYSWDSSAAKYIEMFDWLVKK